MNVTKPKHNSEHSMSMAVYEMRKCLRDYDTRQAWRKSGCFWTEAPRMDSRIATDILILCTVLLVAQKDKISRNGIFLVL